MNREYCGPQKRETRHCMAEQASEHILTIAAIDAARAQLARYALATDWPPLGMVEASDLLDAAREALAKGVHHATA